MAQENGPWTMGRVLALLAAILAAVSLILIIIAGVLVLRTRTFIADSVTATGTVIEMVPRQSCDRDEDGHAVDCDWVYAPRIRFTAADGREITFTSTTASSPPSYTEGDPVPVRYPPGKPAAARIDSYAGLWLAPTIVGGIGVFFAAFAVVWAVLARRVSRESASPSEPGSPPLR